MRNSKALLVSCAALAGLYAGAITLRAATTHIDAGSKIVKADESDKGKHDCKGKNSCKGQGGCKSGDNGCKGQNSCKGKGGCASAGK
jgi:hypothetical protein